jgi:hypothetical protein
MPSRGTFRYEENLNLIAQYHIDGNCFRLPQQRGDSYREAKRESRTVPQLRDCGINVTRGIPAMHQL